jgi:hypothetical protein
MNSSLIFDEMISRVKTIDLGDRSMKLYHFFFKKNSWLQSENMKAERYDYQTQS